MPTNNKNILYLNELNSEDNILESILTKQYRVNVVSSVNDAIEELASDSSICIVIVNMKEENEAFEFVKSVKSCHCHLPVVAVVKEGIHQKQTAYFKVGCREVIAEDFEEEVILVRLRNIESILEVTSIKEQNRIYENLLSDNSTDEKSGLYNRHAFCIKVRRILDINPNKKYVLVRWDVDRFRVFNDLFGVEAGDKFLHNMGEFVLKNVSRAKVYARWEADHFVVFAEEDDFDAEYMEKILSDFLDVAYPKFEFIVRIGVYPINDSSVDVFLMCDRVNFAIKSIKGSYTERIAYYDESFRNRLLEEQEIINEMENAIINNQFVIYLQPKYNYDANIITGVEALVRWEHPVKGLIAPYKFIPIFESNGFISTLDENVWEQVCALLRKWIDEGRSYVPISVNISRVDLYDKNLSQKLINMINKYNLDPELLHLEITESAYIDNPSVLTNSVEELQRCGFRVEMDDFGSGYSTLNSLKDIPFDTIKLDMKFLGESGRKDRSGTILSSIVRMANWLNVPVIAEGVETKEDADFLRSTGCYLMQGYYFNRPMTVAEFESLLDQLPNEDNAQKRFSYPQNGIKVTDFQDTYSQAALLFNSYVGGAVIVEKVGRDVEVVRFNQELLDVIGITMENFIGETAKDFTLFDEDYQELLLDKLEEVILTAGDGELEIKIKNDLWFKLRIKHLVAGESSDVFYIFVENITDQKNMYLQISEQERYFRELYQNVPCGIKQYTLDGDKLILDSYNDTAWKLLKYNSREEYEAERISDSIKGKVHPDDQIIIDMCIKNAISSGKNVRVDHRVIYADGTIGWVNASLQQIQKPENDLMIRTAFVDITHTKTVSLDLEMLQNQVLNESDEVVYISDCETYELLYVNRPASELDLRENKEVVAEKCYEFFCEESKPCAFCSVKEMGEELLCREYLNPKNNKWYLIRGKIIDWNGRKAHIEYIREISKKDK